MFFSPKGVVFLGCADKPEADYVCKAKEWLSWLKQVLSNTYSPMLTEHPAQTRAFLVFLFKCEAACMKQVFIGELAI